MYGGGYGSSYSGGGMYGGGSRYGMGMGGMGGMGGLGGGMDQQYSWLHSIQHFTSSLGYLTEVGGAKLSRIGQVVYLAQIIYRYIMI